MGVDPGVTTGLAWGVFPVRGGIKYRIEKRKKSGAVQLTHREVLEEVQGAWSPELAMGLVIARLWIEFAGRCVEAGIRPVLVIENFVLRIGKGGTSDRSGLAPVRVTAAIETAVWLVVGEAGLSMLGAERDDSLSWDGLAGEQWLWTPRMQTPSEAKGFATNERLKRWGLWEVGKPHARDAWRHVARALAKDSATIGRYIR